MAVPAGNRGKAQPGALQDSGAHRRGSPLVVGPKLFTMTSLGSAIVSPQGPNSELRDAHRVAVRVKGIPGYTRGRKPALYEKSPARG